jgi:RNA polymerase sigma-70 factor (ECF subfamily)
VNLDEIYRADWGHLLSALIRSFGDFDLAEDALQDAFTSAVTAWKSSPPANPLAWLYTAARHNAIDQLRRRARFAEKQQQLMRETAEATEESDVPEVPDERLRLIFTCCHPALAPEAQVALTLRTLCGLKTEEIARAFLVPATTMAQRIVRAKAKIRDAAIPYRVPDLDELPDRLDEVMAVIYLVFNEGYSSVTRNDLSAEAIRLARLVRELLPEPSSEVDSLLALMLLHHSRRDARVDAEGNPVLLAEQDRAKWDWSEIEEGRALVDAAFARRDVGAYAIEAAIAALHTAEPVDWKQIQALYHWLYQLHPSPVVALNGAVAVMMAQGPAAALPLLDDLRNELGDYYLFHSTLADILRRLGRTSDAIASYERAHALAQSEIDRRFLMHRLRELRR